MVTAIHKSAWFLVALLIRETLSESGGYRNWMSNHSVSNWQLEVYSVQTHKYGFSVTSLPLLQDDNDQPTVNPRSFYLVLSVYLTHKKLGSK